jgi:hypothetical protein
LEVDDNIYMTRPDNFNQLRELLHRLLCVPTNRFSSSSTIW